MFSQHNSEELKELFALRSFQGQHPSEAKVIFFGRDANYPEDIKNNETRPGCFALLRVNIMKTELGFGKMRMVIIQIKNTIRF